MRHVAAWVAWWIALFFLWLLLVGEWNHEELAAAAIAATVAASIAELARNRTSFGVRLPLRALADVPEVLLMVLVDFGIVAWALVETVSGRRTVRGELVSRRLDGGSADARGVGPRAWTALAASYSPNAYVIDIEPETAVVLLHDLVPRRSSESPA